MNVVRLQYFIEAARCGNFSLAAQNLYTSQPNLSKQISLMEQELGYALFSRTKRSVKLTAAGQYLFERLRDVPALLEASFEEARQLSQIRTGALNIGVLEGQEFNTQLATRLSVISNLYPDLVIDLERNSFRNLRSGLEKGQYDLIVTLDFDVENMPEFHSTLFLHQTAAIAIHSSHPLADRQFLELSMLRDQDFVVISPEESPTGYDRFLQQCAAAGFVPHVVRKPRSLESLLLCVEANLGCALLDPNIRLEQNVRSIPIPNSTVDICVVCLRDAQTPHLEEYIQILTSPPEVSYERHRSRAK
ncbi:MAG: LysR family transcriptional regulator [Oscillospiraceae bacterium]|nr:LysR family transcriptional regulator [Oscillospiraceae bacterium]